MIKSCIISLNKTCNNCGACNICDIDASKSCNNCGKCLETEVNDYKQIVVDEVDDWNEDSFEDLIDGITEISKGDKSLEVEEDFDFKENPNLTFIDDVDGLNELLEDPNKGALEEVFPGVYILRNKEELH